MGQKGKGERWEEEKKEGKGERGKKRTGREWRGVRVRKYERLEVISAYAASCVWCVQRGACCAALHCIIRCLICVYSVLCVRNTVCIVLCALTDCVVGCGSLYLEE